MTPKTRTQQELLDTVDALLIEMRNQRLSLTAGIYVAGSLLQRCIDGWRDLSPAESDSRADLAELLDRLLDACEIDIDERGGL